MQPSPLLPQAPERFRRWFPLNKRNAEFNAFITVLGFAWLVGPSKLKEVRKAGHWHGMAWHGSLGIVSLACLADWQHTARRFAMLAVDGCCVLSGQRWLAFS